MPNYDYLCESCSHQFETFQSIKASPLKICPECGKGIKRLIGGGAGILFKGTGFYKTDYRSSDYRQSAKQDISSPDSCKKACKANDTCASGA